MHYAESVNAATWNRASLVEAKLSGFCWCKCTHEMNAAGTFAKQPWEERRFTSEVSS